MNPDFLKNNGLLPAIVQHHQTRKVLMLGYVNQEAYTKTVNEGIVTFYSRSKQRLWTKGETSGNFLHLKKVELDCDADTLLFHVEPKGPACHNGTESCFNDESAQGFLYALEGIIEKRISTSDANESYTRKLFEKGINKVAQKVGEEAVEVVIEAKDDAIEKFENEAADLLFHLLILFKAKHTSLSAVEAILRQRHLKS